MKENTTEFQPVGDNIQITLEGGQEKIGSIYLPQNMQKAPTVLAKVVAVGPLCKQIKAGQWAVVGVAQVLVLKLDGNDVAFTKEDRVMAVVDSRPAPLFTIVPEGKSKGSK